MIKIAFPTEKCAGLEDVVYTRFGRSPCFTIITLDDENQIKEVKNIRNPGYEAASGAGVRSVQTLVDEGVNIIAAPSLGPNAAVIAQEMGIKHISIPSGIKIREALETVLKEIRKES
ncbi:MAG: NifB/NifX family molybdenum-iron cluster-binding protein [Desulfurococcaceae archaeon]|nr:NifB/NifX family molybdenum-iron cluster-binding protein [Desulfurococcaceae archaeon]